MSKISRPFKSGGIIISAYTILAVFILACCTTNNTNKSKNPGNSSLKNVFDVTYSANNKYLTIGDTFEIFIKSTNKIIPDSVFASFDGSPINIKQKGILKYTCKADFQKCGSQFINLTIVYSDSLTEQHLLKVQLLPANPPKAYTYKILRKFKHDSDAYTQGLIYVNKTLFESTGQKNKSSIRKLNPKTGDVFFKKSIDPEIFGEGIALFKGNIYMLTYVSHIGFVFDTTNFEEIRKFGLQTNEGWGLTADDKQLIMSDGTSFLYFLDPEYTTILNQVEVCDNIGFIDSINELEETPYGLFANVYGKDYIILIDKTTGIVKGKIDFSGIFPENMPKDMDHVLNGIAFNESSNTFYVTGKYWPLMYEVKINLN